MNVNVLNALLATACLTCVVHEAAGQSVVRGEASYRERILLGPDAVFEARLEDVSRADAPAEVLGTARIDPAGAPPYRFEIAFDAAKIRPQGRYGVRASLSAGGRLQFVTDTFHAVLTHGAGDSVKIVLRRASARARPAPFEGTYWKVVRIGERDVTGAYRRNEPHLVFDPEGLAGRVAGAGGCNRLMGGYRREGGSIAFEQLAGTMMACVEGMDVEQALHEALRKVAAWRIDGRVLELRDAQGALMVRLKAQPPPPKDGTTPSAQR